MEALGIDPKLLVAQLINFGLFAYVFMKFMYKPFMAYLEKQQADEVEKAKLLADLQKKEAKTEEKQKEILAEARSQAISIIKEAEATAHAKREEMLKTAHEEVAKLKQKAEKEMEDDRARMYDDMRSKVVKTSETLASSVLRDFVDEKQHKDILSKVFAKLEKTKVYEN
ncbi:MAG: ATP synthase subunit b [Microgenomates bacterium OLB23]|nr:MAG: ATP synthase subunit b [Microgenomates bacterium OLB23]